MGRCDLTQATKLNAPIVAGGGVVGFDMRADGARISYNANQENAGVYELYEVDFASAGVATKLSAPMSASGVMWFEYTTAGDKMIYTADQDSDAAELYRVETTAPGIATEMKWHVGERRRSGRFRDRSVRWRDGGQRVLAAIGPNRSG